MRDACRAREIGRLREVLDAAGAHPPVLAVYSIRPDLLEDVGPGSCQNRGLDGVNGQDRLVIDERATPCYVPGTRWGTGTSTGTTSCGLCWLRRLLAS